MMKYENLYKLEKAINESEEINEKCFKISEIILEINECFMGQVLCMYGSDLETLSEEEQEAIKNMIIDFYKNKTFNLVESRNKKQEVE